MFSPGDSVKYNNRHFVFVRYRPGMPRTAVIRDDEAQEMVVEESKLRYA
jgi:hypothetical protein